MVEAILGRISTQHTNSVNRIHCVEFESVPQFGREENQIGWCRWKQVSFQYVELWVHSAMWSFHYILSAIHPCAVHILVRYIYIQHLLHSTHIWCEVDRHGVQYSLQVVFVHLRKLTTVLNSQTHSRFENCIQMYVLREGKALAIWICCMYHDLCGVCAYVPCICRYTSYSVFLTDGITI